MDQQLRRPDSDLRDAGLGIEHRGRPRRPARSRLCGLLCGRRLFLCAAFDHLRPFVLDLPAARRNPRRDVGHHSRLSGPEAARRLSRDRHAGLRRDHPHGADQLGRPDQRLRRHQRHSACHRSSAFPFNDDDDGFAAIFHLPYHADLPHDLSLLSDPRARAADQFRHAAAAPPADRAGLGGAARGRDRLPLARHQHHQHQAHRVRARRDVRRLRRLVLRRAPGLRQPGELHLHRIGDDPRHRRARRHGLAARRRHRRRRP